jgi:hypothetical protein
MARRRTALDPSKPLAEMRWLAYGEDVWFWHPLLVLSSRRLVAQPGIDKTLIRGRR